MFWFAHFVVSQASKTPALETIAESNIFVCNKSCLNFQKQELKLKCRGSILRKDVHPMFKQSKQNYKMEKTRVRLMACILSMQIHKNMNHAKFLYLHEHIANRGKNYMIETK